MNKLASILRDSGTFFGEVTEQVELKKCTWPTRRSWESTVVVIVSVAIVIRRGRVQRPGPLIMILGW
jgi:preprotein translocase subunit SecE